MLTALRGSSLVNQQFLKFPLQTAFRLKACHDFTDKHKQVPEELMFVIHDLEADYKKVYRDLTELKLNNY